MQIRLLIKKAKILSFLKKDPKESAHCLIEAQERLDLKMTQLNDLTSNEGANDKKQMTILRQKIYYHKGLLSLRNNDPKYSIKYFL
jgi:hypothetical protein